MIASGFLHLPSLEDARFWGLVLSGPLLIGIAVVVAYATRRSPAEKERRRRNFVNTRGRMGEAFITEASAQAIHYNYSIAGVYYTASQDVSALAPKLPVEIDRLIGHATMKYDTRNPANSILVCESWSGLRHRERPPAAPVELDESKAGAV